MLIKLNRNYLKAMLVMAAKDDIRYYFNAVNFVGEAGKILAYATNGHHLIRWIVIDDYQDADFNYFIDRIAIKTAIKTKDKIFLDAESGAIVCEKNNDFRRFYGLLPASPIGFEKVISKTIEEPRAKSGETDQLFINGAYLEKIGKISRYIAKVYKVDAPPVRHYAPKSKKGVSSIFTIGGCDDIMVIAANLNHNQGVTQEEHRAVLMNNHPAPKSKIQKLIDDGLVVICGCSNKSLEKARIATDLSSKLVVGYDGKNYIDKDGDIWKYVYYVDAIKPKT